MEFDTWALRMTCIIYGVIGLLYMAYVVNPIEELKFLPLLVALVAFLAMVIANNKGKWYVMMITPFSYTGAIAITLLCANFYMFSVSDTTTVTMAMFRYTYASIGYLSALIATISAR